MDIILCLQKQHRHRTVMTKNYDFKNLVGAIYQIHDELSIHANRAVTAVAL